jgi:hypothetical protein
LEPKGIDRPNPMVGFPRLQAREEVKCRFCRSIDVSDSWESRVYPMASLIRHRDL